MKHLLLTTIAAVVLVGPIYGAPIHEAVENGDLVKVKSELEGGCDVNLMDDAFGSPLHYAAMSGYIEIIDLLLINGADVNSLKYEYTPLDLALEEASDSGLGFSFGPAWGTIQVILVVSLLVAFSGKRDVQKPLLNKVGWVMVLWPFIGLGCAIVNNIFFNGSSGIGGGVFISAVASLFFGLYLMNKADPDQGRMAEVSEQNTHAPDPNKPWCSRCEMHSSYTIQEKITRGEHGQTHFNYINRCTNCNKKMHVPSKVNWGFVKVVSLCGLIVTGSCLFFFSYKSLSDIIMAVLFVLVGTSSVVLMMCLPFVIPTIYRRHKWLTWARKQGYVEGSNDEDKKRWSTGFTVSDFLVGGGLAFLPVIIGIVFYWDSPSKTSQAGEDQPPVSQTIRKGNKAESERLTTAETPINSIIKVADFKVVVRLLRKHGGKTGEEIITLFDAVNNEDFEAVKEAIADGIDVNIRDEDRETLLHNAATKEIAKLLIAKGADVNAKDIYGTTPLHYANTKEIAQPLIAEGADVNAKDDDGKTPLNSAIRHKHPEIVDLLRKHGGKTGEELKAEGK